MSEEKGSDKPSEKRKDTMTNRTIGCEISKTKNLGNMEFIRFGLTASGTIEDGANKKREMARLYKETKEMHESHLTDLLLSELEEE